MKFICCYEFPSLYLLSLPFSYLCASHTSFCFIYVYLCFYLLVHTSVRLAPYSIFGHIDVTPYLDYDFLFKDSLADIFSSSFFPSLALLFLSSFLISLLNTHHSYLVVVWVSSFEYWVFPVKVGFHFFLSMNDTFFYFILFNTKITPPSHAVKDQSDKDLLELSLVKYHHYNHTTIHCCVFGFSSISFAFIVTKLYNKVYWIAEADHCAQSFITQCLED